MQESGEKALSLHHHLKLHQWGPDGGPTDPSAPPPPPSPNAVHSWQYDEIVFNEPYQSFLNILMKHPPAPLPNVRKKPVPPHQSQIGSASDADTEAPEFSAVMERDEAEKLEAGRKNVIVETDKVRAILIAKEKELEQLKKRVEDL